MKGLKEAFLALGDMLGKGNEKLKSIQKDPLKNLTTSGTRIQLYPAAFSQFPDEEATGVDPAGPGGVACGRGIYGRGLLHEVPLQEGDKGTEEHYPQEWEASHPGGVPGLRDEGLQDREGLVSLTFPKLKGSGYHPFWGLAHSEFGQGLMLLAGDVMDIK